MVDSFYSSSFCSAFWNLIVQTKKCIILFIVQSGEEVFLLRIIEESDLYRVFFFHRL